VELVYTLDGYNDELRVPFYVELKPWPEFTDEELEFAKTRIADLPKIRVNVECPNATCKCLYVFQEQIVEEQQLPRGVHRFPDEADFACRECEQPIPIKDIRGQIREAFKKHLKTLMGE
jgi:hypothetical protein